MRRLVTISYTGLDAGGGVPKFNRDLHAAFPDRECIHFCGSDLPSNEHRRWEWEQARALNLHLIQTKGITRDDVIIADGFWTAGLESFPFSISHSHGIWSHLTHEDVLADKAPENPFHHTAQVSFRRNWLRAERPLTAVSAFIARQMYLQWGFQTSRVIENGVDTNEFRPRHRRLQDDFGEHTIIVHGINDQGNTNKGWDHILAVKEALGCRVSVLSLDELHDLIQTRWPGCTKAQALAQADLVVHPSAYEGNSMFVAEALACGVPVVGYDVGYMWSCTESLSTVIDRAHRSPQFTTETVKNVLRDPMLMREAGSVGREIAVNELDIGKFRNRWRSYVFEIENAYA